METTLEAIGRWLTPHRPGYASTLRSPASDESIEALKSAVDARLPDDFVLLYRWHDGQDPHSFDSLVDNWMFMPVADVIETKAMLDGMIGYDFDDPETWRRGWVPFMSNGGGSYLCLDLEARRGVPGQLIAFWKGDADRPITHPSVRVWADEMLEAMRNGCYDQETGFIARPLET